MTEPWPDNAPGPFHVTRDCIYCWTCPEEAPGFFEGSDDETHLRVVRQPRTPAEEAIVMDALLSCPVHAIRRLAEDPEHAHRQEAEARRERVRVPVIAHAGVDRRGGTR